jgi:RNA-directed DNA polymerase
MPRHTLMKENPIPEAQCLIERMVERDNMVKALNRVKRNKGAAGIDGMTVDELPVYLQSNWHLHILIINYTKETL